MKVTYIKRKNTEFSKSKKDNKCIVVNLQILPKNLTSDMTPSQTVTIPNHTVTIQTIPHSHTTCNTALKTEY